MNTLRRFLLFIIIAALCAGGVWGFWRYRSLKRLQPLTTGVSQTDLWTQGIEKVKADRGEPMGANAVVEIPTELRHYSDRRWFLATQVAAVRKLRLAPSQDFLDLGAMIQRGELVSLPAATTDYILVGVGAEADESEFSRFVDGHNIELYDETKLRDAYTRLESAHSQARTEIATLKKQSAALKKNERAKQAELRKLITAREQDLKTTEEARARLDRSYGQAQSKATLLRDYESLQALAKNLGERSFNLDVGSDRLAMKVHLLSSLRPAALKILEEIARGYRAQFDRPLTVSSLVRPEQYQHALRRVNRNATLIETPPHSTGLAFDIDYRYMSAAEQTFVMNELARLENEGRIEVIRERNANYHIFAFADGRRPSDNLITASLQEASGQPESDDAGKEKQTHHAAKPTAKASPKSVRKSDRKQRTSQKRSRPSKTRSRR